MFGFFKKQSKNKDFGDSNNVQHVEPVLTVAALNNEDDDTSEIRRRLESRVRELSAQVAAKDSEANQLKDALGETKRQLDFRSAGMDHYQAELEAAYIETECLRKTLKKTKDEMTEFRLQNEELKEQLVKKEKAADSSDEDDEETSDEEDLSESRQSRASLETRVKELEEQLEAVRAERDELLAAKKALEDERQEEIKIIHEALEEALAEKEDARTRFEKDYEQLRTVNSDREQQMLDDFEWKLRQVEQAAKKRVDEKNKEAEKKVLEAKIEVERKIAAHERDLEKLRVVNEELTTLRNVSHEQQRLIRVAQREHESMQVNESILKDQITRLNAQVEKEKNILAAVQTLNQKKLDEREQIFECRVERQRQEAAREAEQKVRSELQTQHKAELQEALRLCREQHENEKTDANKQAQNRIDALQKQIATLKDQMSQKEAQFEKVINTLQVNSDQDALELRRKLDKLDMSYQDKLDALTEKHQSELEEAERRVSQAEMQAGSSRATLELVKEQMARDADEKFRSMHENQQQQLARQQRELRETHEEQIVALQAKHEAEIAALCKGRINGDLEIDSSLRDTVNKLRKQELMISDLTSTIREQDHALTTLTQEKRALQLQMSGQFAKETSPIKGLERISECTEPSRESSASREEEFPEVFSRNSSSQSQNQNYNIVEILEEDIVPTENVNKNEPEIVIQTLSNNSSREGSPYNSLSQSINQDSDRENSRHSSINDDDEEFEEFEDPKCESPIQKFVLNLPKSPFSELSNNLSLPNIESERSNYLSISPCRSDATNCLSIPTTPSPERSITISKTSSSNPEISEESTSNELQIPRTYFLSHSPDSIFPKEKIFLSRSKSLGLPIPKMHLFSRAASCPALQFISSQCLDALNLSC